MTRNGDGLMTPEDRQELEALLEPGIDTTDKRGYCLGVISKLRSREENGDEQAARIITAKGYDGVYRDLDRLARRETSVFRDTTTGRILNLPKTASIARRNPDGTKTGERQLAFWESLSRIEYMEWLDHQTHLAESMRMKVRGHQRVVAAWEKFPHAVDAGHACILAGIDPDEIEIEDAA